MGWIVFLAVLAFFTLLIFLKISVCVISAGDFKLKIGIGIFKFTIFPSKPKELRLSDYRIDKFRKKQKKKQESEKNNKLKRQKKRADKASVTEEKTLDKKKMFDGGISEMIEKLTDVASVFISRFGKHLVIKVKKVYVSVGSSDAATTALLYAGACSAVVCLFELLETCTNLRKTKNAIISVVPDYTNEKTVTDIDITFSFRVWQIFDMLIRTLIVYFK